MRNKQSGGSRALRALLGLAALPIMAWCQTPVVTSLVNAASYQPTLGAPGSIASVFGSNLAAAAATAQAYPLPRQLGGASVTWNGVAAPLLYVSPTQINFQVPSPGDETPGVVVVAGVVVSTAAGNSVPFSAPANAWQAFGIFSMDGSGCGQGAVLNVAADGSVSVNSSANSASPGGWISIYATGLDLLAEQYPPDGAPTPLTPLIESPSPLGDVQFDLQGPPGTSQAWQGLAPGLVGVDQTNVQIPASVREGCAVPVQIAYEEGPLAMSQPVTLAIRQGGGPCVDPPAAGYGQITWQKTVSETETYNTVQPYLTSEADTVTVSLQSSPGMTAPAAPAYSQNAAGFMTLFGPSCPVPGYRSLAAGTVTAQGPGLTATQAPAAPFQLGQLGGLSAYQATLSNGTIQAGTYPVTASGGADVGAFQATTQIGADIQIQTPLAGATVFSACAPFTINWSGGDPNSWTTVELIQQVPASYGGYQFSNFAGTVSTSDGTITMYPPPVYPPLSQCVTGAPGPIVISIEVDPDPSEVTAFSASGLSLGGQATWKYVHTFQAGIVLP